MRTLIIGLTLVLMTSFANANMQGWQEEVYYFETNDSWYIEGWEEDFGDFYFIDRENGLIYHPRTASWWYVYGESSNSLYLYGYRIANWIWTRRGIYPWFFSFGSKETGLIGPGWGYINGIEVRPDGTIWADYIWPRTDEVIGRWRVVLPF